MRKVQTLLSPQTVSGPLLLHPNRQKTWELLLLRRDDLEEGANVAVVTRKDRGEKVPKSSALPQGVQVYPKAVPVARR